MNTLELRQILSCVPNSQVCASNELKLINAKVNFICVNTHPNLKNGEHWQGLVFFQDDKFNTICIMFDSLGGGSKTLVYEIKKFIESHAKVLIFNGRRLQSTHTSLCGLFVAHFLLHMSQNLNFEQFLSIYTNNEIINEKYVFNLFYQKLSELKHHSGERNNSSEKYMQCISLIKRCR